MFELVLVGGGAAHEYVARVPAGDGGGEVESGFEWRSDSAALAEDLAALERAALSAVPVHDDLHVRFGQQLYGSVFGGAVGELWRERLNRSRRRVLRLVLRIDPSTARPLLNLPWEYLHDGKDFLALNWRTPLSRLPWGLEAEALPALTGPLRLLVVIAAPSGLDQNMVLNTAREEDLILAATAGARKAEVEVVFAANGSLEGLEAALREHDPHILHFTGHGVFDRASDAGWLLMEGADGSQRRVANEEFVRLLERRGESLRLVFLSACQSAVAPRQEGYTDLAPRLLEAGIPAVVAMQFSVLNRSAMEFGATFYRGAAAGEELDRAMVDARGRLAQEGLNGVDFATPVLFLTDPGCLRVEPGVGRPAARPVMDLTGLTTVQNFAGRAAELSRLQTNLDPERGPWRAAVVHGLGGMGKTVLAARLAERMRAQLDGVKSLRMTPTTTAQQVLEQLVAFLLVNNARFNLPEITELSALVEQEGLPLEAKAARLIEVLRQRRLLLVFDNYEDVLSEGRPVSRAGEEASEADPDLARLVRMLVEGVSGPSRLLFTSRVDFSPLEAGRLTDAVGHVGLGEMGFRDAVYLMETLAPLSELPVAVVSERAGEPVPGGLSMREVHGRLGGHPYTLNLFAEHARRTSVEEVLADLSGVRRELLEFTLLERAVERLGEGARELLERGAIYDEPVPAQGLAYLVRDAGGVLPAVEAEVEELLGWGLLARPPGSDLLAMPVVVREWVNGRTSGEGRVELLRAAAGYWLAVGRESKSLEPELNAYHYLFEAGDYEAADDLVRLVTGHLLRWGQYELLHRLLSQSVRTLSGQRRAIALGNLALVHQALGDYARASDYHRQALTEFRAAGNQTETATALHQLGTVHYLKGEYEEARGLYQQALEIERELGDRSGIAAALGQLGNLHEIQGDYGRARQLYQEVLHIERELGNRAGMASGLHQLGILHLHLGEYERARELYQQALDIHQELGNRAGEASSLHQLGILHHRQAEYERARELFQQSLDIELDLGNRAGVAISFQMLAILHQDQGEYERARELYQQALDIHQELGNRAGEASSLHQLGTLHHRQREYERAGELYQRSLDIDRILGHRAEAALTMAQMSLLLGRKGDLVGTVLTLLEALETLEQLGRPEAEQIRQMLAELREEVGDQAYSAAARQAEATLRSSRRER